MKKIYVVEVVYTDEWCSRALGTDIAFFEDKKDAEQFVRDFGDQINEAYNDPSVHIHEIELTPAGQYRRDDTVWDVWAEPFEY